MFRLPVEIHCGKTSRLSRTAPRKELIFVNITLFYNLGEQPQIVGISVVAPTSGKRTKTSNYRY